MIKKHSRPEVPQPAHPQRRREPLPWHKPKSSSEDPEGPGKLDRILNSSSYIPAVEDVDFLFAETAEDIWEGLLCWYERNGETLIEEIQ